MSEHNKHQKSTEKSIVIFLSSSRPGRMGDRVLKLVKEEIEASGNKASIFDPINMDFDMLKVPLHFMPNPDAAPAWMKEANAHLETADAFLFITAEFNSSLPPALTNMLDYFPPVSFRHRPCGIISYSIGYLGGIRAATLLPIMTIELGMLNIPRHVNIPNVQNVINENGECRNYKVCADIVRLVYEIDWFAEAIRNKKKRMAPPT